MGVELLRGDLENFSVLHQRVDFAVGVLGEAVNVVRLLQQRAVRGDFLRGVIVAQPPEGAEIVVAVNVNAVESRGLLAMINITADHAEADAVVGKHRLRLEVWTMRIFDDGCNVFHTVRTGLVKMRAFADAPTVVSALGDEINFLPQILADVADPERAGLAVKTVTPRVAQAVGVNFMTRARTVFMRKRIVLGNAVAQFVRAVAVANPVTGVDVKTQHFCEQGGGVLAAAERIAARATIAEAEVKKSVQTKCEFAALVVAERLRHFQHDALGFQIGLVRLICGDGEFADDAANGIILRLRVLAGGILLIVINVKQFVRLEARMKRDAQQAAFVFTARFRIAAFDVEKFLRVAAVGTFFDDKNFAGLIHDKQPARTVRRFAHPDRALVREPGKNGLKFD